MVFINSFLRRAPASILPLTIRSAGTHSAFDGVIFSDLNVQNRHLIGRRFLQLLRFSTATGENIGGIESANSAQQFSDVPDGFPFEIVDDYESKPVSEDRVVSLKRQFEDEIIRVEVKAVPGKSIRDALRLHVDIVRSNGCPCFHFEIDASPGQMTVPRMSIRGNLEAFKSFWEVRGMKPETVNFLFDYFETKNKLSMERTGSDFIL